MQYQQRTEWNVRDSDGTLILTIGKPSGGTALTGESGKPEGDNQYAAKMGGDLSLQPIKMARTAFTCE